MGKLVSIIETARRFGMTEQAIRDWIKKGYITPTEVGGKNRFKQSDIYAFLKKREESTGTE